MLFENISFIKPAEKQLETFVNRNFSPMFRKKFRVASTKNAKLYVCGLGYGYYYINGKEVSKDRFTAPVSDYSKTLWYNVYDVSELLRNGENTIAVWCGNGFYNEDLPTTWHFDKAEWRDVPKFILRLDVGDENVLVSDGTWKYTLDGPVFFNALRSGEYFDARKYDENWASADFDDSSWEYAQIDDTPPKGVFRECLCEPVREFDEYKAARIAETGKNKYLFDIGQNISGYIRLNIAGKRGQMLTIRYAEQINDDFSLQLNKMDCHYKYSAFQTDKFICSGKRMTWSPKFCYHGFRYIEIEGLEFPDEAEIHGVFVHQAVDIRTDFECSNGFLNKMFKAGVFSVYSNMFYIMTDCPTREKLGWTNDAQGTAEQILTNFKSEKLFEKWLTDIYDAMKENGELPGIVPTAGWGYNWGNGPVSDGILFEIPYRIYIHTGNAEPLKNSLAYFDRYFNYITSRTDADGFVRFGLHDWANPQMDLDAQVHSTPTEFINAVLLYEFYRIASVAAEISGDVQKNDKYKSNRGRLEKLIKESFLNSDGKCTVETQTAVSMLIYYHLYDSLEPLKTELAELIEKNSFRHDCGMVGIRRLYAALNICGLEEYAYKILTAKGYPSYADWFEQGATTLWEYWKWDLHEDSKNHHMYSDFMSWMVKTILGINCKAPGFSAVNIEPYFFNELEYASGSCDTSGGKISVNWKKDGGNVRIEITVPDKTEAYYEGKKLLAGKNCFTKFLK